MYRSSWLLGAVILAAMTTACSALEDPDEPGDFGEDLDDALSGDVYKLTFDFEGLGESDVLPAWRSTVIRAAEECQNDRTIERVRIVFENMPDNVGRGFARSSITDCDELVSMANQFMTD
jgi:hypothetical protein